MKIFVTGANGFLGKSFYRAAREHGHEVLGLVRRPEAQLPEGCLRAHGSLAEIPWDTIEKFAPDAALNLAWVATPGTNFHSPENTTLIRQSDALFRGLIKRGVTRLAGTGTFIEYATSRQPLSEDVSDLLPLYPYSRAKAATLENLKTLAENEGVAWLWFRIFNAYGEGENRARMTSAIMLALAAGCPTVVKTPDSVRDYIHVSDVGRGMMLSLEQHLTGPLNIGSGTGTKVLEIAKKAALVLDAAPDLVRRLDPPAHDSMPIAIADTSRLRGIGWSPQVSLDEGLQRLWKSLKPPAAA